MTPDKKESLLSNKYIESALYLPMFNINGDKVHDIKTLENATKKDITFFNSIDYKDSASKTRASACITNNNLKVYVYN